MVINYINPQTTGEGEEELDLPQEPEQDIFDFHVAPESFRKRDRALIEILGLKDYFD